MNQKTLAYLALPFILLQVIRFAGGERGGLLMVLAILATTAIRFRYHKRQWRSRIKRLRSAPPPVLGAALKRMDPRERSAARLYLGISSPDQTQLSASDEELFSYQRPAAAVGEYIYWASLICAAVPLILLALDRVSEGEQNYFLAVGTVFGLSVLYQLHLADRRNRVIRVTPFGVQEVKSSENRVGILWNEIAAVRWRRMPKSIEISATDGKRRIRVGFDLEEIARFLELLKTNTRPAQPRIRMEEKLVEETRTPDGWAMSTITTPDESPNPNTGYGWVIAADGTRAGLVWHVGEGEFRELMPPDSERWGVYVVRFPKPVLDPQSLADNFNSVLPELRARYEHVRSELHAAAASRPSASVDACPSLRITRIRENPAAELVGKTLPDSCGAETGAELDTLHGYWSRRAAIVLSSQPTWSVSIWTKVESENTCVICAATISKTQNTEHFISSTRERICPRCFHDYVDPDNLGFIIAPAPETDAPNISSTRSTSLGDRISFGMLASGLFRAVGILLLLSFIWMFLQSWSTDTQSVRILTISFSAITLVVAFGLLVPSRRGSVFRFFAGCLGAGYLLTFYFEARRFLSSENQQLTFRTPAIAAAILLLAVGAPLLIYALHRRVKRNAKPARGELYRSKKRVEVKGVMNFRTRSTGGFRTTIPRGELVSVEYDPPSHATAIYAIPQRYNALERILVPPKDRKSHYYASYALVIPFDQLANDFERVRWHEAA